MESPRAILIVATSLFIVALAVGQSVPNVVSVDTSYFAHGSATPAHANAAVASPVPLAFEGVRFDPPWIAYVGPFGYVFARYNGQSECALVNYALGQWFVSFRAATAKPYSSLADAKTVADKGCEYHAKAEWPDAKDGPAGHSWGQKAAPSPKH
jgi:hypothetical protein